MVIGATEPAEVRQLLISGPVSRGGSIRSLQDQFLELHQSVFRDRSPAVGEQTVLEKLGKTWAKNQARIGPKLSVEGCKGRRINNKLD